MTDTLLLDDVWPRDAECRYRIYARNGDLLEVLAAAGSPSALGTALVQLHEDQREQGRTLNDLGRIGILDVMPDGKPAPAGVWVVLPYSRKDGAS